MKGDIRSVNVRKSNIYWFKRPKCPVEEHKLWIQLFGIFSNKAIIHVHDFSSDGH